MLRFPLPADSDNAVTAPAVQVDALPAPARGTAERPRRPQLATDDWTYGTWFWSTYAANTCLMIAVTLLFRYSDFVNVLGGTELQLGWIVGAGAIGSLAMRLAQGTGVDRYGPRTIWLASVALVVVTLLGHLLIGRPDGVAIYLIRIAYHTGIAGAFGASIAFVSLRAPVLRMAELLGMLGTSGFVGMIVGAPLGDQLCRAARLERWHLDRLFLVAAGLAALSLLCAGLATRGQPRPAPRRRPAVVWLLRRYHPGRLLLMGAVMGVGLGLPGTFLRPFAETLGIGSIATFFATYAAVAFVTRLATRRLPDRLGFRCTILMGMTCLASSMILYLVVGVRWQLAMPAVAAGLAHALLFPSVLAGGSRAFPARHRGIAVALMLGMFDLGNLLGMPLAGTIAYYAPHVGLPSYPTMFLAIAVLVVAASGMYAVESTSSRCGNSRSNGAAPVRIRSGADNRAT